MNIEKRIEILEMFYQGRDYHGTKHIMNMLDGLVKYELPPHSNEILEKAILFHDAIYHPGINNNEEQSCVLYDTMFPDDPDADKIKELIMVTKHHIFAQNDELAKIIVELDLSVLHGSMPKLIDYEHSIFNEFQHVDIDKYIEGRVDFLEDIKKKITGVNYLDDLIQYIKTREYKIGIYPGSFNPFHVGHMNIVKKAEQVFDKVVIALGINSNKTNEKNQVPVQLWHLPKSLLNQTIEYTGLVTELFKKTSPNVQKFFIRGLRNVYDIGYEETLRKTVHAVSPDIKFVYFFCDSELEHVSSSMIRELLKYPSSALMAEAYIIK